jgi:hypothetical protein
VSANGRWGETSRSFAATELPFAPPAVSPNRPIWRLAMRGASLRRALRNAFYVSLKIRVFSLQKLWQSL